MDVQIAYVEDEADIREVTHMALETIGNFKVQSYGCGVEALTHIPQEARPDLFLLDVMMPNIDGRTLFKALRELPLLKDVPTIFMTAKTLPSEVRELREMGAITVIPKPFDPMTLAEEIRSHMLGATS